jgi:hypothetical protein
MMLGSIEHRWRIVKAGLDIRLRVARDGTLTLGMI